MKTYNAAVTKFLWQLYDQQGRPVTTEGVPKLQAVIEGWLHGSAHIWLWRRQNGQLQVLLQKRSGSKINWPGWLDKSAGGHILYGEQPIEAAMRKVHTELGLTLDSEQFKFVGVNHWLAAIDGVSLVENDL